MPFRSTSSLTAFASRAMSCEAPAGGTNAHAATATATSSPIRRVPERRTPERRIPDIPLSRRLRVPNSVSRSRGIAAFAADTA